MSKSKRERRPLIDDAGEVRELLLEDIRQFRPAADVLPPSLLAKLGIEEPKGEKSSAVGAKPQPSAKDIAAFYGLSLAESRLALALANGERLDQIAAVRGVHIATVRSQLSTVLRKLRIERQSDINRSLARVSTGFHLESRG